MSNGKQRGFWNNLLNPAKRPKAKPLKTGEEEKKTNLVPEQPATEKNESTIKNSDHPVSDAKLSDTKPTEISKTYEFIYLEKLVRYRLNAYFQNNEDSKKPIPPKLEKWSLFIPDIIREYLTEKENKENYEPVVTILLLTLVPHVLPDLLDIAINDKIQGKGDFQKIGGVRGKNFRGFIPTYETAVFLLADENIQDRFKYLGLLSVDSFLQKKQIVRIEDPPPGEPMESGKLIMEQEYVEYFTTGKITRPGFGMNFPAQLIVTPMEWSELVLPSVTLKQIDELLVWIKYNDKIIKKWGIGKKLKPGYRILFHGPPGTGKTLTATLLGKKTGRDVYKIDLSLVISKYIGETEKNLGRLFDKAKNKDWILFFDEADALFGKRTNIRDAHDKYANQEVSYLLQRIEEFPGLVILASNFKRNIDEAFTRRFQDFIYFPPPKQHERTRLWETYLPDCHTDENRIDVSGISRKYELNGGNIVNIVRYACLQALEKKSDDLHEEDLLYGIQKEYSKEGKIS